MHGSVNNAEGYDDASSSSSDEKDDDDPNEKGEMRRLTFKYAYYKFQAAFFNSLQNRYLFANLVYLVSYSPVQFSNQLIYRSNV